FPEGEGEPEGEEEGEAGEEDAGTESILARLLEEGTGFRLEDIGTEAIPDLATLVQILDTLGDITVTEQGDTTLFDLTISNRTVEGAAELDIDALGGALFLHGDVEMSAVIDLHLVFGVDGQGFFVEASQ